MSTSQHEPGDVGQVLQHQLDRLTVSLALWANRDESAAGRPQPEVTEAGNDALSAIDALLRELHQVRSQLVSEYRTFASIRDAAWRAQHPEGAPLIDGGSGPFWPGPDSADSDEDR